MQLELAEAQPGPERVGRTRGVPGRRRASQPPRGRGARRLGGGQVLGLVDGTAHADELALKLGHAVVQGVEVVAGAAPLPGELLLEVGPQRALGMDLLLGRSQPAIPLPDRLTQPLGLSPRVTKLALQPLDVRGKSSRLPLRAVGGRRRPARPPLLEDFRPARPPLLEDFRPARPPLLEDFRAGRVGRDLDLPDRKRHHHPAELEEGPAGQPGRQHGRDRKAHPPGPRRRAGQ